MHLQVLSAKHGPLCFGLSVLRFKLMIGPRGRFRLGRRGGLIRLWLENIGPIKVEEGDKAQVHGLWQVYVYIKNHYLENDSYHFGTGSHSTNKIVVVVCKQNRCYFGNCLISCGHTIISLTWESPYLERGFITLRPSAHLCVFHLTIISSDNGLLPGRRQAIIWTNAGILLIRT